MLVPVLMTLIGMATMVIIMGLALENKRKMAEIEAGRRPGAGQTADELSELKTAVNELREQLHAQMIAVDSLLVAKSGAKADGREVDLEQRLAPSNEARPVSAVDGSQAGKDGGR